MCQGVGYAHGAVLSILGAERAKFEGEEHAEHIYFFRFKCKGKGSSCHATLSESGFALADSLSPCTGRASQWRRVGDLAWEEKKPTKVLFSTRVTYERIFLES